MIEVKLEKKEEKGNEIFYRYQIGGFKVWFTQNVRSGDIFTVSIAANNKEYEDFDLCAMTYEENDHWYPVKFTLRGFSSRMTTAEAAMYAERMTKVCTILDAIQNFFETSFHANVGKLNKN